MVGTGLERHPGRGATHIVPLRTGVAQGHHLGVRAARLLRVPLAEDAPVGGADDAPDPGVGVRQADGQGRQVERGVQPLAIEWAQLDGWWCQVLPLISGVAVSSAGHSNGVVPSPARMTRKFLLISGSLTFT